MMSLAIDNDQMMQLTGQNQFTSSLSGGYKMTNGRRVRKLFKNWRSHQRKRSSGVNGTQSIPLEAWLTFDPRYVHFVM